MRMIILCEDGRHVLVGDYSVGPASAELQAQGLAGWVANSEGDYYGYGKMKITESSVIGTPRRTFQEAVQKFEQIRTRCMGE